MLTHSAVWTLLISGVHLLVISLLAWQVFQRTAGGWRYLGFGLLFPWFGTTIAITLSGITQDMTAVLSPLGVIMTTVIVAGLALLFYWQPLKHVISVIPLSWLMGIQVYRVLGSVFLFGWLEGVMPLALGPLTAFNDVFVGVTAVLVVMQLDKPYGKRLAQAWNVFGLFDFAYAITIGVLAAPHALQILALTPDTAALGQNPFALITLWAVPLSVLLHTASLMRLRQSQPHLPALQSLTQT